MIEKGNSTFGVICKGLIICTFYPSDDSTQRAQSFFTQRLCGLCVLFPFADFAWNKTLAKVQFKEVSSKNNLSQKVEKGKKFFRIIFQLSLVITLLFATADAADRDAGVLLLDAPQGGNDGNILFSQNKDKPFIPASIVKILTSLAAIHYLGEQYHFITPYSFDPKSKNLYIKGYGDPLLTSEVMEKICLEILESYRTKEKVTKIHDIILDQSYYAASSAGHIHIPGKGNSLNPYDAPLGALSLNYNTVNFQWDNYAKRFISGEKQTPLLNVFLDDIKKTGLKKGRIVISSDLAKVYPGLLLKYFLEKQSMKITGKVREGRFIKDEKISRTFQSPYDLNAVIHKLLRYSNNFIANQILLTMGARTFGPPATLEKGIKTMQNFIEQELKLSNITIEEGSGLSRRNRISPAQMILILKHFMPYHDLLRKKNNDLFKTGTLTGVKTRAGYLLGKNDKLYPYVIMVNKPKANYDNILNHLKGIVVRAGK